MKHKVLKLITMAFFPLFLSCGQEKEPVSVTGISLSPTLLEITEGDIHTLSINISPSNADNKSVSWTSTQPAVASVQEGTVTAHKEGTATIIVTTADGGKTATCTVNVAPSYVAVSEVSLNHSTLELLEGESSTLSATILPEKATNKNVIWTSSDTSVIIVDNGKVTAIKEGTATITVTTEDGNKSATCEVTVLHDEYNDAIVFADEIMKEVCVSAFDTNGDGELSYKEAACVSDMTKVHIDTKIVSFDEFQYFISVKQIPRKCFAETRLETITLPNSIESIAESAFEDCKDLSRIVLSEGLATIGRAAFSGCTKLTEIHLPNSVREIGREAFADCRITSIIIPEGVKIIEQNLFRYCTKLMNVTILNGVESIGDSAFAACISLSSLTIPESVSSIGNDPFYCCSTDVYMQGLTPPDISRGCFRTGPRTFYVPIDAVDTYKNYYGWDDYSDRIRGYDFENDQIVE